MEISITRGLAELKLLTKRIESALAELRPCAVVQGDHAPVGFASQDDFVARNKARLQSVVALIQRRAAIKSAIVLSNAATNVKVGGVEMTVAEAIERKSSIELDKQLLAVLSQERTRALSKVKLGNASVRNEANQRTDAALGENAKKSNADEYEALFIRYFERNQHKLVEPRNLEQQIDEMRKRIEDFEMEVDFILSESNTVTKITVPE